MTRTPILLSLLLFACDESALETESESATDGELSAEEIDEEAVWFDPSEGHDEIGDDFNPDEFPEWTPAPMRSGAYWMTVLDVVENSGEDPLEAGWGFDVWAPYVGGVVMLWGYAPLETDGDVLRADGMLEIPHEELDCTVNLEVESWGETLHEDSSFTLEVIERTETFGADCTNLGMFEGTTERAYVAEFNWMEPQNEPDSVDAESD